MPTPPRPPVWDATEGTWHLSRYRDVLEALHDPRLQPAGARSATEQHTLAEIRSATHEALSHISELQSQIEPLARSHVVALPADRPIDLVGEFAEPWCTEVAVAVTGAKAEDRERLLELARCVSAAAADPDDPELKSAATRAELELDQSLPARNIPAPGAVFVGLAQTLPGFLANAWLALFRHPNELSRLHSNPGLMPAAIEELFRYAGLARKMVRIARAPAELGGAQIGAGQRVTLALNSANRDPEQFTEPNRLDLTRREVKHVALGAGPHSCAGASLIRMASVAATSAFVQRFHAAALCEPIEWRGGAGFRAPAVMFVRFQRSVEQ